MRISAIPPMRRTLSILGLASALVLLNGERLPGQASVRSASQFVQHFYDWYVPSGVPVNKRPWWGTVLAKKSGLLSSALLKALTRESKYTEEENLQMDPFVNSQDPCEKYTVGKASRKGSTYSVEVYAVCNGKQEASPSVVARLRRKGSKWIFVNFSYSAESDLLTLLKP
jgi:hypothetical protein